MTEIAGPESFRGGRASAPSQGGRGGAVAVGDGPHTRRKRRRVDLDPARVNLPIEPTREEAGLREEQEVARCEILMLKGVRQIHQLSALLGHSRQKTNALVRKVHARWEITAGAMDIRRHRGEALHKLDLLENELWSLMANTDDPREKIVSARTLLDVQDRRNPLLGLTPDALKTFDGTSERDTFAAALGAHTQMKAMAERMSALLRGRVLENLPEERDDSITVEEGDDASGEE